MKYLSIIWILVIFATTTGCSERGQEFEMVEDIYPQSKKGEEYEREIRVRRQMWDAQDPRAGVLDLFINYPLQIPADKFSDFKKDPEFVEIQVDIIMREEFVESGGYQLVFDEGDISAYQIDVIDELRREGEGVVFATLCYKVPLGFMVENDKVSIRCGIQEGLLIDSSFIGKWKVEILNRYSNGEVEYDRGSSMPKRFSPIDDFKLGVKGASDGGG